jgi:hypothetical protein
VLYVIKHRMYRSIVLLQLFELGPTSYLVLCALSFIWALHMHIRIINLIWAEGTELKLQHVGKRGFKSWQWHLYIYISQTDPKYPLELLCLLFDGCQMCFPWSMIITTSLRLQSISSRCRTVPQTPPPSPYIFMLWSFGITVYTLQVQVLSLRGFLVL